MEGIISPLLRDGGNFFVGLTHDYKNMNFEGYQVSMIAMFAEIRGTTGRVWPSSYIKLFCKLDRITRQLFEGNFKGAASLAAGIVGTPQPILRDLSLQRDAIAYLIGKGCLASVFLY